MQLLTCGKNLLVINVPKSQLCFSSKIEMPKLGFARNLHSLAGLSLGNFSSNSLLIHTLAEFDLVIPLFDIHCFIRVGLQQKRTNAKEILSCSTNYHKPRELRGFQLEDLHSILNIGAKPETTVVCKYSTNLKLTSNVF